MKACNNHRAVSIRHIAAILVLAITLVGCGDDGDGSIGELSADDFLVSPSILNFPQVAIGSTNIDTVRLDNRGTRTIRLESIQIVDSATGTSSAFTLLNPWEGVYELDGGEQLELEVEYAPQDSVRYGGMLTFETNIADSDTYQVEITAGTPQPELFTSENVNFTRTPINTTEWQLLEISNIGFAPLKIDDIAFSGDSEFSLSFPVALEGEALEEDEGLGS